MPVLLFISTVLGALSLSLLIMFLIRLSGQLTRENQATEKRILDELSRNKQENENKLENFRSAIGESFRIMREENEKSVEMIRTAVEEKLQGTLESKLTESFGLVSERLEQVYRGLGEMQTIAAGVGDLKKVLSNVKTRGVLGEVQLEKILEQVMAPDQYARNFSPGGSGESVEFAVILPGREEKGEEKVFLPIDAKFPIANYEKLLDAQEKGDKAEIEKYSKALDNDITAESKKIQIKYILPPLTTDFAVLFLPIEGLFAEAVRKPGLVDRIQRENRVVIAGPTTLWAIMSSLQMGFRTLAIQKRSSEVWKILGAVKTEWTKYGDLLLKIHKKLDEASNVVSEAQSKSRTIGRKLREVQELPSADSEKMLEN